MSVLPYLLAFFLDTELSVEGEFCACTKHHYCMEPLPSLAVRSNSLNLSAGILKKQPDAFALANFHGFLDRF